MSKEQQLQQILKSLDSVCVGYSGGVDSVFLAVTALDVLGPEKMLAVTGRSASYPDVQWDTARTIAREFGIPHLEIETDEMQDPNYLANPNNRCYFCKSELWSKFAVVARENGLDAIVDGSNADDAHDYRPGAQAARENQVRSPLQEAGLTKAEIRELSRARGLPTWDQPSAPCLSSRLPYGLTVTPERLRQVEQAEQSLRDAGLREFRVRHHGDVARIEVAPSEMERAIASARTLEQSIRDLGFERVLLDVEGYRRGALNGQLVNLRSATDIEHVTSAGHEAEIAVVARDIPWAQSHATMLKQNGYRYVAVDLRFIASSSHHFIAS